MPRRRGRGLLLGAALTAAAGAASAQAPSVYDGSYVGELTLTRVFEGGDCTPPPLGALYPLTVSRGEVRFAYVPRFNTTLTGRVGPDGNFQATARLKRGAVQMTGQIRSGNLTAYIVSPSCNYTFQTKY